MKRLHVSVVSEKEIKAVAYEGNQFSSLFLASSSSPASHLVFLFLECNVLSSSISVMLWLLLWSTSRECSNELPRTLAVIGASGSQLALRASYCL